MEQETDGTERVSRPGKPSRRSTIMRGVITPIFGLLAVTCIVLGVMNATVWKPSPHVDAQGKTDTRYVVTDPGVLPLVDNRVSIRATPERTRGKAQVCMALTTAQDAAGWTAGQDVTRVKGLDDWETLDLSRGKTAAKRAKDGADGVAFADSDMWRQVKCGGASTVMTIEADRPDLVLLVDTQPGASANQQEAKASAAQSAVKLQLSWERSKLPDFAIPFYFSGGLLVIMAVLSATVFAMDPAKRRKKQATSVKEQEPEVTVAQALGSMVAPGLGKKRKSTGRHRRHAVEGSTQVPGSGTVPNGQAPQVIDPTARNMVANQATSQQGTANVEGQGQSQPQGWSQVPPRPGQTEGSQGFTGSAPSPMGGENVVADSAETTRSETLESGRSVTGDRGADDISQTSVISLEEMSSYLARLANEGNIKQDGEEQS